MVVFRATSISLFLALAACSVGEIPIGGTPTVDAPVTPTHDASIIDGPGVPIDGPPAGNDPSVTFTMIVTPIVTQDIAGQSCAMSGCHSGAQAPNLTSYGALQDKYKVKPGNMNILVTHGKHTGPALAVGDARAIAGWIDSLP